MSDTPNNQYSEPESEDDVSIWSEKHQPLIKRGGPTSDHLSSDESTNGIAVMGLMAKCKRLEEEIEVMKSQPDQTLRNANVKLKRSLATATMERDSLRDKLSTVLMEFQNFKALSSFNSKPETPVIDEISKGLSAECQSPTVAIEEHDTTSSENTPEEEVQMALIDARAFARSVLAVVKRKGAITDWEALEVETKDVLSHLNSHLGVPEVLETPIVVKIEEARAEAETRRGPAPPVAAPPAATFKERVVGLARDLVDAELQRPSENEAEPDQFPFQSASEERWDAENLRTTIAQSISGLVARHGAAKAFACVIEEVRKAKLTDQVIDEVFTGGAKNPDDSVRYNFVMSPDHAEVFDRMMKHFSTHEEIRQFDSLGKTNFDGFVLYVMSKYVRSSLQTDAMRGTERVPARIPSPSNLCQEIFHPTKPVTIGPAPKMEDIMSLAGNFPEDTDQDTTEKWYHGDPSRVSINGPQQTTRISLDAIEDIHGMLSSARTFYTNKQVQHPELAKMCRYLAGVIQKIKTSGKAAQDIKPPDASKILTDGFLRVNRNLLIQLLDRIDPSRVKRRWPHSNTVMDVANDHIRKINSILDREVMDEGDEDLATGTCKNLELFEENRKLKAAIRNLEARGPSVDSETIPGAKPEDLEIRKLLTDEVSRLQKENERLLIENQGLVVQSDRGITGVRKAFELEIDTLHSTIKRLQQNNKNCQDEIERLKAAKEIPDPTVGSTFTLLKSAVPDNYMSLVPQDPVKLEVVGISESQIITAKLLDGPHDDEVTYSIRMSIPTFKNLIREQKINDVQTPPNDGSESPQSELTRVLTEEINRQNRVIIEHRKERSTFLSTIKDLRRSISVMTTATPYRIVQESVKAKKLIDHTISRSKLSSLASHISPDEVPLDVQNTRLMEQNDFLREQIQQLQRTVETAQKVSDQARKDVMKYKLMADQSRPNPSLELLHELRSMIVLLKKGYPITSTRNQQATKTIALLDGAVTAIKEANQQAIKTNEVIQHHPGPDTVPTQLQVPRLLVDLERANQPKHATEPVDPDGWFCPLLLMNGTVRVTLKFVEDVRLVLGKLSSEHDPIIDQSLHMCAVLDDMLRKAHSAEDLMDLYETHSDQPDQPYEPGHPDNPVGAPSLQSQPSPQLAPRPEPTPETVFVPGQDTPPQSIEDWEKWVESSASYAGSVERDITYPLFGLTSEAGEISKEVLRWFRQTGKVKAVGSEMPVSLQKKIVKEAYDCMHHLKFILSALDKSFLDVVQIGYKKLLARERAGDVMNHTRRMSDSIVGKQITLPREIVKLTWTVARSYGGDLPANRKVTSEDWVSEFPDKEFTFYVKEEHGLKLVLDPAQSRIGNRINGDLYIKRRDFYPNFKEVEEEDE